MIRTLMVALLLGLLAPRLIAQDVLVVERMSPANAICPVQPQRAAKGKYTVSLDGREVSLCCRMCVRKFLRDPEGYTVALDTHEATGTVATQGGGPPPSALTPAEAPTEGIDVTAIARLHPVLVHFPIALLIAALIAECIGAAGLFRGANYAPTVRFCLWGGLLAALPTAAAGWFAAGNALADPLTLETHRWLGVASLVAALLATTLEWRAADRTPGAATVLWRGSILLTALLVGAAGHYGGALVHGIEFMSLT